MTLTDALQYLETTSRVSCPQITCDQAREIADWLERLREQRDGAEMKLVLSYNRARQTEQLQPTVIDTLHAQLAAMQGQRDEALEKLREVERERRAEIDCGQSDLCAKPPGCQKHWAFKASELVRERDFESNERSRLFDLLGKRNSEFAAKCMEVVRLERERDEAQDQIDVGLGLYETTVDNLVCEREDRELDCQIACGFAWDAGREMAALMAEVTKAERDALRAEMEALRLMPVEAAPDFDADDYAKPGKR